MTSTTFTDPHHHVDEGFLTFLLERLGEEVVAANARRHAAETIAPLVTERGLQLLEELVRGLENGEAPDHLSLGLLTVAYHDHPDFRRRWNRWTPAD